MLLLLLCQKILDKQTSTHGETVLVRLHIRYVESGIKILRRQREELNWLRIPIALCAICEGADL